MDDFKKALRHFAPEAVESGPGIHLVLMAAEVFLKLASPIPSRIDSVGRSAIVRSLFVAGCAYHSLPELEIQISETSGDAFVVSHDGRHRVRLLSENGFAFVPVLIRASDHAADEAMVEPPDWSRLTFHPQPHDDEDDYPGMDSDDLETRARPLPGIQVVLDCFQKVPSAGFAP